MFSLICAWTNWWANNRDAGDFRRHRAHYDTTVMGNANHHLKLSAWSSIAQSVCQRAFSLLEIRFQRHSGLESCIQQRKTTCLLSILKSLARARASKLTTTNMYIARSRWECQTAVGSNGLNARWSYGWAVEFKFLAWPSIAQSVCQRAFSLLEISHMGWCRIWSWSPMPCEKHGPRDSVDKNRGRRPRVFVVTEARGSYPAYPINNNKHVCM